MHCTANSVRHMKVQDMTNEQLSALLKLSELEDKINLKLIQMVLLLPLKLPLLPPPRRPTGTDPRGGACKRSPGEATGP